MLGEAGLGLLEAPRNGCGIRGSLSQQERPRTADSAAHRFRRQSAGRQHCHPCAVDEDPPYRDGASMTETIEAIVRRTLAMPPAERLRAAALRHSAEYQQREVERRARKRPPPTAAGARDQLARTTAPATATTGPANRRCGRRQRAGRSAGSIGGTSPANARVAGRGRSCWRGSRGSRDAA